MQRSELISIITPFYNAEKFLAEAINSILAQTYTTWELILIDDCSTDCSLAIARGFALKEARIKIISLSRNKGTGIARNRGLAKAKGHYIAFLDADDLWRPHKLEVQLKFMRSHDCLVTYTSYELIDNNGETLDKVVKAIPVLDFKKLLKSNYIGNLTGIYNAAILGKFDISPARKRQDWAMWLDILKKTGTARGILEPLAFYRIRENSISSNKPEMIKHNFAVYRKHLGYSYLKSLWMMIFFLREHFWVKPKQIKSL